jgi:hypothetical protein
MGSSGGPTDLLRRVSLLLGTMRTAALLEMLPRCVGPSAADRSAGAAKLDFFLSALLVGASKRPALRHASSEAAEKLNPC